MIERLEFNDGTSGYQYPSDARTDAMAGSWDMANRVPDPGITWQVDDLDDGDDLDPRDDVVSVDVGTLVELLRLARIGAQYAGCSTCRRVTLV